MLGKEKLGRVLGSLRSAEMATGVFVVIIDLSGVRVDLASSVKAGRTCRGSLVRVRRSRSEK